MALNKKLPMSDRINTNSIAKDIDIITGLNFSPNIKNNDIDTNENDKSNVSNESNVIDITTTSSNNKTTNKTKQNNSNEFQPFLNKIVAKNDTKDDRKIKQEIESLIMLYTTSIQTRCENDDSGNLVKKRCFENNDNSNLLSDVLNKVEDLVKQLSISNDDKNEYFNTVINDFICDRLSFMIKVSLEEQLKPSEIEESMKVFLSSGSKYMNKELQDYYFNTYKDICFNAIYSRVDRHTFYFSELLLEVVNVIKLETKNDMSALMNDVLLSNIDEKYIEKAKENIYNRIPVNKQFNKNDRKKLKEYGILVR